MSELVSWGELRRLRPDLAETGRELFYQWGVGLGFLATTRRQGAPRLHPICPSLTDEMLYAFLIPSPSWTTCCATRATRCTRT